MQFIWMCFILLSESITSLGKISKSLFNSKAQRQDRWLEWSEKMKVEAEMKREEFLRKQEEAGL